MTDELQPLRDALALTTNALHDRRVDRVWTETLLMAQGIVDRGAGADVLMAQAHLTIRILEYVGEVAANAEKQGITLEGVPGGTTPENMLAEFGRQLLETEGG